MFKKTKVCTGLVFAFGGTLALGVAPAFGQQQLDRVEITGSAIKRIDAETAVPVTIIKIEDLKKSGVTTVEEVVNRLGSNQQMQGTSQNVGLGTGGAAFANLRGLGQNKTLVLLNGRRLANNAIDSSAPDLNMIPFAALERVEVLRDGASALYGTDAIGGVINFITKKDYRGGAVTVGVDSGQHKGGGSHSANVSYGFGDLEKDRFNVFGVLDYQKDNVLRSSQRDFADRSLKTSPTTFPGQYNQGGNVQNPSFPTCGAPHGIPTPDTTSPGDATCGYLYAKEVDMIPRDERISGLISGTLKLGSESRLNLEYFYSQNKVQTLIAGVPYGALNINPGTAFYPGNGITPLPTAFTLNPNYQALGPVPVLGAVVGTNPPVTQAQVDAANQANADKVIANTKAGLLPGFVKLRMRDELSGGRQEATNNKQQRLVASLDGVVGGWDYNIGAAYNENKLTDSLIGGYTDGTQVTTAVRDGIINPFGDQTAAGLQALSNAAAQGVLFTAKGQVYTLDGKVSRELGDWMKAGRPAAIAVGTELRREKFQFVGNPPFDALVISSTGFDPATDSHGSRTVTALFTELNVPIIKEFDITAALRYDRYSDFGNTTNPKVSFRYQPNQQWLVRGSASTGFRAPSLYDINAPQTFTNSANNHDDPVRCAGGNPVGGVSKSDNCAVQFLVLNGGNKNLQPEKSKNMSLGLVFEPMPDFNVGIDLWWIKLKASIGVLSDDTIFGDPTKYAPLFKRAADGSLATDGSLCNTVANPGPACGYVVDTTSNLGEVHTSGVDLSANYKIRAGSAGNFTFGFNGTYINKYELQHEPGGPFFQAVGVYEGAVTQGGGPIFRWQHTLNALWNRGEWSLGLVNRYKSSYVDQDPVNTVGSYSIWDMYGTWQPNKSVAITAGLKNLFDKDPPYSNQAATFQVGYDPRYADPAGRMFYVRGTYSF